MISKLFACLTLLGSFAVEATDLFCIDPETQLRYPLNSTWTATTFCGNYRCELRHRKSSQLPINNNQIFLAWTPENDHIVKEKDFANKPSKIQNNAERKIINGLRNIDDNFQEFDSYDPDDEDAKYYNAILEEYYKFFANDQRQPVKDTLKEMTTGNREVDSTSNGNHPEKIISNIDQTRSNNDDDITLYYDHVNNIYTPTKPKNFDSYQQYYNNYLKTVSDTQTNNADNKYQYENSPENIKEESSFPIPLESKEVEVKERPEFKTDDTTVLSGWTYNDPVPDNKPDRNYDREIKELSEEMGVNENTVRLAMIMDDQESPDARQIPTVHYSLGSDSKSEEEEEVVRKDDKNENIIDLTMGLIRSLTPSVDKNTLSRNQRSSMLSRLRPLIRERFSRRSRHPRSVQYEEEEEKPSEQSHPEAHITIIGCPESTEPGYYMAGDPTKPFPHCCPKIIHY